MIFKLSVILLFLISSCTQNGKKNHLFTEYKSNNSFFHLNRDSIISTSEENEYVKFELGLLDGWKTITGYFGTNDKSLEYMNTKGETFEILMEEGKQTKSVKGTFSFYITEKHGLRTYYYSDSLRISNLNSIIDNSDTIYRILIHDFGVMHHEDNLMWYISRNKGIVGAAAILSDSSIIYYQGEIYSDTNLTLAKKGFILQ